MTVEERLAGVVRRAGCVAGPRALTALLGYLELLARWNSRMNLTALPLDRFSDAALDRLVGEPLVGAGLVGSSARSWYDLGTGSGSPAIPMKIVRPELHLIMVESRSRKASFLREAARVLDLEDATVVQARIEALSSSPAAEAADLVTVRGVRLDERLIRAVDGLLRSGGQFLAFGTSGLVSEGFREQARATLPGEGGTVRSLVKD